MVIHEKNVLQLWVVPFYLLKKAMTFFDVKTLYLGRNSQSFKQRSGLFCYAYLDMRYFIGKAFQRLMRLLYGLLPGGNARVEYDRQSRKNGKSYQDI